MKISAVVALTVALAAGTFLGVEAGQHGSSHRHSGEVGPHGHCDKSLDHHFFSPEVVLKNQIALGLSEDQIVAIKNLLHEAHGRVLDYQTDLDRATERLHAAMEAPQVDEASAMAAAEDAMKLEAEVKKAHLELMLRIKNLLTEAQQAELMKMKPAPSEPE
jgi:Spy/CpxP family protein refolding chaperone